MRRSFHGGEGKGAFSGDLEVEDTYVLTSGAKLMNCLMLHTFKGRMCVLSSFDESYSKAEVLESLLHGTFAKLLVWLDIETQHA